MTLRARTVTSGRLAVGLRVAASFATLLGAAALGCGSNAPSPASSAGLGALTTESSASTKSEITAAAKAPAMTMQPVGTQTGDAIETGIRAAAGRAAADMQPEGPLGRAELAQGMHATMEIKMRAGRCYALVGFGSGIQDLDLHLLTPPNYDLVSAEDESNDNTPVIGRTPHAVCPATTVDLPFKVDAFAEAGGGSIGVQLFSRPGS